MVEFYYIIFGLIIVFLAILIYSLIYNLYTKKINKVLRGQVRPGNYGSLDKKFFTVIIACILVLIVVFLIIASITRNKSYTYEIPFYDNISEFKISNFEKEIKNTIKPKDGFVSVWDGIIIETDNSGRIIDVELKLIVKRGREYYRLYSEFNDENNIVVLNGMKSATVSSTLANTYISLSSYSDLFSRINFSDIGYYCDMPAENYGMRFELLYKNASFHPAIYKKMITKDSSIVDLNKEISGVLGNFIIYETSEKNGLKISKDKERYLLIP